MKALCSALPLTAATLILLVTGPQPSRAAPLTPKSVPIQIRLAEEMAANEDWEEAARRWIDILYYFGPSDQDARAEFELGRLALRRGRSDLAIVQWEKAIARQPEGEWAERARAALKLLGKEPPPSAAPVETCITEETPDDERQFLVAEADMAHGLLEFAIRDFLKVPDLYPDSSRAAEARFRVGTCQALLGRPDLAIVQWQRVIDEHPDVPHAHTARAGIAAWQAILQSQGAGDSSPASDIDPGWQPLRARDSAVRRGLSYAEDLCENGNIAYALQEYAKVLCDIYTPKGGENPYKACARYRMAVCAYRLRHRDAAGRQWRRLLADFPDSAWAQHASSALAAVGTTDPFSSDAGQPAPALPPDLPSPLIQRFHLAEQLVDCGLPLVALKEYLKVMFVLTAGKPNPLQAEASYKLALCQHRRGRPDLARTAWEHTAADYPDTPWAEKASLALSQAEQRERALAASLAEPTP